ncbi:hypothetical protein [Bacillus pinisoli]|uniref:hypothetical protein n=1 Tax=Bacillus pinisoli TaxID=2901866 RepID=UPI001FF41D3E|nr:hypothetical protein [Bacillus pinisoli]
MTLTKRVSTWILIGSSVSWLVWILVETLIGKGLGYNVPGLLFGLVLTLLAFILYISYFRLQNTKLIYILLTTGCLFSITLYIYAYFFMQGHH